MDQARLPFEYLDGKTYACKGDKTIWANPFVVDGTRDEQKQQKYYSEERQYYDARIDVYFNPKGYCNEETTLRYMCNRPFKSILKDVLDEIMEGLGDEGLSALDDASPSAGSRRSLGAISNFHMVGMSLPVDESCDSELKVKGLDELQIGDWRRDIPVASADRDGARGLGVALPLAECEEQSEAFEFFQYIWSLK
ncbi:hypothetical protein BDD12DRAFT_811024 [Trichophaea hybrida]|nr:hypothetical protein BDD12DRAFT_811024 [Trichophaea hybrida]